MYFLLVRCEEWIRHHSQETFKQIVIRCLRELRLSDETKCRTKTCVRCASFSFQCKNISLSRLALITKTERTVSMRINTNTGCYASITFLFLHVQIFLVLLIKSVNFWSQCHMFTTS